MNNNEENNVVNQNTNPNIINTEPVITPVAEAVPQEPVVVNQQVDTSQPQVAPQPQQAEVVVDTNNPEGAINENLKKVEVDYKPPSKAKTVMLILFFIALIAFVIFLPEITEMVSKMKADRGNQGQEKITTGRLKCTYSTNTTNLDKDYSLIFGFTDNKLEKLDYRVTTKGDATLDEKTLDELSEKCKLLKEHTSDIDGISVSCDYSEGKLVEKQSFVYGSLDEEKLDAAYAEAGGTNPQYTSGQDMDSIEKDMNASGYTCNRERN